MEEKLRQKILELAKAHPEHYEISTRSILYKYKRINQRKVGPYISKNPIDLENTLWRMEKFLLQKERGGVYVD